MSIGNTISDGNKGINFPWQLKMLLGQQCACDQLTAIAGNTDQVEFLLTAILTSLQAGTEYEAKFVLETCPGEPPTTRILLEVRVWDTDTSTWGPITYYVPGSDVAVPDPIGEGCTLEYTDPSGVLGMILAELQSTLDVNVTNSSIAVTQSTSPWIIGDGGGSITVDGTVTANQGTSPWAVSLPTGTNTSYYNRIVGAGLVVPAGATSVSVQNIGSDNITITTDSSPATIIDPGVSLTFDAQEGKTLGAYTFANSSGSSLYVVTQVR